MTWMIRRGGYRQVAIGVSFTPSRRGHFSRIPWEVIVGLGRWLVRIAGDEGIR